MRGTDSSHEHGTIGIIYRSAEPQNYYYYHCNLNRVHSIKLIKKKKKKDKDSKAEIPDRL